MNKIKELRGQLKLTQKEFAEGVDLTQGALSRFEKGSLSPSVETGIKMVQFARRRGISLTLDALYGVAPLPSPPRGVQSRRAADKAPHRSHAEAA